MKHHFCYLDENISQELKKLREVLNVENENAKNACFGIGGGVRLVFFPDDHPPHSSREIYATGVRHDLFWLRAVVDLADL